MYNKSLIFLQAFIEMSELEPIILCVSSNATLFHDLPCLNMTGSKQDEWTIH